MTLSTPQLARAQKELQQAEGRKVRTVTLVRVFVSHSSDTQGEIEVVHRVIRRFHALPDNQLFIQPVLWEDHDTPDLSRIQEVVNRNTRLHEVDLFVGVYRGRIGTPTRARDAHGREYPGGAVEELATAREMEREGKLSRIMLYFCSDPPKPATQAERDQARQLAAWLGELRDGETGGLLRDYTTLDDFANKLFFDLLVATDEFHPAAAPTAAATGLVAKLCDRVEQVADFGDFIIDGLRDHPGRPHACVLWGDEKAGHTSLVERLIETRLKRLAARLWPEAEATVEDHEPEWPEGSQPADLQRRLSRTLLDEFDDSYMGSDRTARTLTRLDAFRRPRLMVLHHDVPVERWSRAVTHLIAWYLNDFWHGLPVDPARPEILVFLKLVCPPGLSPSARQRVQRDLRSLCGTGDRGCRRTFLPELEPVETRDVVRWLDRHWTVGSASMHRRLAEEVFRASDGRTLDSRSMEEVEEDLEKLLKRYPTPQAR